MIRIRSINIPREVLKKVLRKSTGHLNITNIKIYTFNYIFLKNQNDDERQERKGKAYRYYLNKN